MRKSQAHVVLFEFVATEDNQLAGVMISKQHFHEFLAK
jgi:hypothetical protein